MKKIWNNFFSVMLVVFLLICQTGCGAKEDAGTQKEVKDNSTINNMIAIDLYYVDADWKDYVLEEYNIDQLAAAESMIDSVMVKMLDADQTKSAYTPVPSGMTYQRYTYDGEGTVTLIFNMDYESISSYNMLLCKAAFTNTLCQLEAVNAVTFQMINLIDEQDVQYETYHSDNFTRLRNVLDSEYTAVIYYPYEDGTRLKAEQVVLDMSVKESLENQIINCLRSAEDVGYINPFPRDSLVNNITINDGICCIDVNEKFLKGKDDVESRVIIYSIVNSLMSIEYIDGVRFSVGGGSESEVVMGDMDLSLVYRGNYSFAD